MGCSRPGLAEGAGRGQEAEAAARGPLCSQGPWCLVESGPGWESGPAARHTPRESKRDRVSGDRPGAEPGTGSLCARATPTGGGWPAALLHCASQAPRKGAGPVVRPDRTGPEGPAGSQSARDWPPASSPVQSLFLCARTFPRAWPEWKARQRPRPSGHVPAAGQPHRSRAAQHRCPPCGVLEVATSAGPTGAPGRGACGGLPSPLQPGAVTQVQGLGPFSHHSPVQ